ncbi:MAG: protease HtpX [Bdellovibrio sp.]|nr:protease HtpX [Bdellovibrio sp.]
MKRWILFFLVNILVMLTLSIVGSLLGIGRYGGPYGINYQSLMIFCLFWGMGGAFISLLLSKFMAKMFMGVRVIKERGQYDQLVSMVHRLAKKGGIEKMPEVGVYESSDVNAFATGATKNSALVAVSTGLLQRMNEAEVEGVIAHEITHITNGDMITMTLIQGVVNAFVMFLSRIAAFALSNALRGDRDEDNRSSFGGGFMQIMMVHVFEMIFGLMALPLVAWFSRYREFRADSGGARLAGKEKMIAALQRLKQCYPITAEVQDATSGMQAMQISSRSNFLKWISTHPDLDRRISALMKNEFAR